MRKVGLSGAALMAHITWGLYTTLRATWNSTARPIAFVAGSASLFSSTPLALRCCPRVARLAMPACCSSERRCTRACARSQIGSCPGLTHWTQNLFCNAPRLRMAVNTYAEAYMRRTFVNVGDHSVSVLDARFPPS